MSFNKVVVGYRRWKNVQATVRELNQLHDRELNDLGIGRGQIREIAQQSIK